MARGRAAGYDDQREAILAHAAELFAHRGYAGTTMNDIADACGLSKATLTTASACSAPNARWGPPWRARWRRCAPTWPTPRWPNR